MRLVLGACQMLNEAAERNARIKAASRRVSRVI